MAGGGGAGIDGVEGVIDGVDEVMLTVSANCSCLAFGYDAVNDIMLSTSFSVMLVRAES